MKIYLITVCTIALVAAPLAGQDDPGVFLMNLATGTSANPAAAQMPMLMEPLANWNAMFMGTAFVSDIQQSGPRGGDKLYSTNWFMASAEHRVGAKGAFEADADAQPGAGDHHGPAVSAAISNRRDSLWRATGRRPASA